MLSISDPPTSKHMCAVSLTQEQCVLSGLPGCNPQSPPSTQCPGAQGSPHPPRDGKVLILTGHRGLALQLPCACFCQSLLPAHHSSAIPSTLCTNDSREKRMAHTTLCAGRASRIFTSQPVTCLLRHPERKGLSSLRETWEHGRTIHSATSRLKSCFYGIASILHEHNHNQAARSNTSTTEPISPWRVWLHLAMHGTCILGFVACCRHPFVCMYCAVLPICRTPCYFASLCDISPGDVHFRYMICTKVGRIEDCV